MFVGGAILAHIDDDVAWVPLVFGIFFCYEYFASKRSDPPRSNFDKQ